MAAAGPKDTSSISSASNRSEKTSPTLTWNQVFGSVGAGFAAASSGVCLAFTAVAQPQFEAEDDSSIRMNLETASWFASLYLMLCIPMTPIGGFLSSRIGRRKTLLWVSVPTTLSWILIGLAPDLTTLFIGRVINSISNAAMMACTGVYIAETTHPQYRSSLTITQSILMSVGILTTYSFGFKFHWRSLALISTFPSVLLFATMLFLPETPYWLIENDQLEDAKGALEYFRQGYSIDLIDTEIEEIQMKRSEKQKQGQDTDKAWVLKRLMSKAFLSPFTIIVGIRTLGQGSGMTILTFYMVTVVKESGTTMDPKLAPIFVGIARVITACFSTFIIQKMRRKVVFVTSVCVMSLSNLGIALFYHYSQAYPDSTLTKHFGWLPVALVVLIFICDSLGYFPLINLLLAELFPTDIRTVATGVTLATALGMGSAVVKLFPTLKAAMGMGNMFFTFAASGLLLAIWGACFIPENKGLTLAKVEEQFDSFKPSQTQSNKQSV